MRPGESASIASFLGIGESFFIQLYTRLAFSRRGLSLVDGAGDRCVFLDRDNLCSINPVKPGQCRDFPARWRHSQAGMVCPVLKLSRHHGEQRSGAGNGAPGGNRGQV